MALEVAAWVLLACVAVGAFIVAPELVATLALVATGLLLVLVAFVLLPPEVVLALVLAVVTGWVLYARRVLVQARAREQAAAEARARRLADFKVFLGESLEREKQQEVRPRPRIGGDPEVH